MEATKNNNINKSSEISINKVDAAEVPQLARDLGTDPTIVKSTVEHIKDGMYSLIAARDGSRYIGSVILSNIAIHEEKFRELMPGIPVAYSLFIHPDYLRQGIGTRLMDKLEDDTVRKGYAQILLGVTPDNNRARTMYEQRGYTYLQIDGDDVVKSEWEVTGPDGSVDRVVVEVLPMVKTLKQTSPSISQRVVK